MLKVLFLIHDLGGGGAEKVLVNLVNNLDPQRFDVTLISLFSGGVNEQFLKPHVHYKTIYTKTFPANSHIMKLLSPSKLHKLIVKDTYDIEIAYLEGPCTRIISGCKNERTKLVSWIHSKQSDKRCVAKSFRSFSEARKVYKKYHKIVCVSEDLKRCFSDVMKTISNVDVLYNTQDTESILKLQQEEINDIVFKKEEICICGVGKIVANKGFERLLRIHQRLKKEGYLVHTYILGDGSDKTKLEKFLTQNELKDSVSLLGYKKNPYKYMRKCNLYVCSSYSEGFSTTTTEALILGIPVVTTNVSGAREILGNNEYGVITENDETSLYREIKNLLDNPEKMLYYKQKAIERGEKFVLVNTVSAVEQYLESLTGVVNYDT